MFGKKRRIEENDDEDQLSSLIKERLYLEKERTIVAQDIQEQKEKIQEVQNEVDTLNKIHDNTDQLNYKSIKVSLTTIN